MTISSFVEKLINMAETGLADWKPNITFQLLEIDLIWKRNVTGVPSAENLTCLVNGVL